MARLKTADCHGEAALKMIYIIFTKRDERTSITSLEKYNNFSYSEIRFLSSAHVKDLKDQVYI